PANSASACWTILASLSFPPPLMNTSTMRPITLSARNRVWGVSWITANPCWPWLTPNVPLRTWTRRERCNVFEACRRIPQSPSLFWQCPGLAGGAPVCRCRLLGPASDGLHESAHAGAYSFVGPVRHYLAAGPALSGRRPFGCHAGLAAPVLRPE